MNFEITNIIKNQDLKIKLLTYNQFPVAEFDLKIFNSFELKRFNSFGSNKRKREFYFTRILWYHFVEHQNITYSKNGKPTIKNGHISISHSSNTIAISYSNNLPIGLDIEHYNQKIFHIKNKFLSKTEQNTFDLSETKTITTLWSIKEAVYKLLNIQGLSFKKNICITKIGELNLVSIKTADFNRELTFNRLVFDEFILTYCILSPKSIIL